MTSRTAHGGEQPAAEAEGYWFGSSRGFYLIVRPTLGRPPLGRRLQTAARVWRHAGEM